MKKNLIQQVRNLATLGCAWRVIYANGRSSPSRDTRRDIEDFAANAEANLTRIQRQLNRGAFTFKPARGVPISKKGRKDIRPLVIAPVESRIVQRAIHDVLLTIPAILNYAENPYSFGGVKKRGGNSAAVPAAIGAVLTAIGNGGSYTIRSDISAFFTKIPKPVVTKIVAEAVQELDFSEFFSRAITVELDNLAKLRQHASAFPIHEIGVAQGNSLSPLLGNLLLYEFDQKMNQGDCRCIRYIDDFIILAPTRKVAESCFFRAQELLKKHGIEISEKKTFRGDAVGGFEFLGIELVNGYIRPSKNSRKRLIESVSSELEESRKSFHQHRHANPIGRSLSLIETLFTVRGIVQGWGNAYYFCNEKQVFAHLDSDLDSLLRGYLGAYKAARNAGSQKERRALLGVPLLEGFVSSPFPWPKNSEASIKVSPKHLGDALNSNDANESPLFH